MVDIAENQVWKLPSNHPVVDVIITAPTAIQFCQMTIDKRHAATDANRIVGFLKEMLKVSAFLQRASLRIEYCA